MRAGRSYRLYKPVGLPSSAPLVVMLHGGFGSAKQAERSYGWDELADSEKFLVAYPDGYHRAWNANGGGCCGRLHRHRGCARYCHCRSPPPTSFPPSSPRTQAQRRAVWRPCGA
ncbi:hypothetical protein BN9982_260007 [Mycobacterium tuberculosis]|nr:hypothetical protein BN9982_260007 [Mycobacterium tuberculosis]